MFQSLNTRNNALFGASDEARETAIIRAWDSFNRTREAILKPTWEDRVIDGKRFGQDTRLMWDENIKEGVVVLPGREKPVRFTLESPFLQQLCAHYQIDKRLVDRLISTGKTPHREVMEFLISSLMLEPFKEVKGDAGRMIRIMAESDGNEEAMSCLSSNFLRLDHGPYFQALETWARQNNLTPVRAWAKGGDAGVSLVQARDLHPNGIQKGQLMAFGITTKNSMTGGASFEVGSWGLVLICTNGMTGSEFLGRFTRRHIGRRIQASDEVQIISQHEERDVATILDRAHTLVDDAMNPEHHAEVQDAVRTAAGMNLESRLQGFRDMRATFMENQKAQGRAAQELQHHLGLSMGEAIGVLNRWFDEPAGEPVATADDAQEARVPTAWGLIQATTRLGRDLNEDKPDRGGELEAVGGSMLKRFRDNRRGFEKMADELIRVTVKA